MTPYYQDDAVTLWLADCRDVIAGIGDASIDMVFTDPPYGHNNNNGDLAHRRELALGHVKAGKAVAGEARPIANDGPEANDLVREVFGQLDRIMKPGSCCCCCCAGGGGPDPQFARWSLWLDEAIGFKQAIVWDKGGLGMGWHYRRNYELVLVAEKPGAKCKWYGGNSVGNVVRISGIKPTKDDHPTPKPVSLPARFIEWHSLPGDIVFDPFNGGGSTAVAAKAAGRRYIGCDVDERWLELTATRLSQGALDLFGAT